MSLQSSRNKTYIFFKEASIILDWTPMFLLLQVAWEVVAKYQLLTSSIFKLLSVMCHLPISGLMSLFALSNISLHPSVQS